MKTLEHWDVEDRAFWDETGKRIAMRNLWISIPNLLCGFSVWLYWGMVAKIIRRIHIGNSELFDFSFGNNGSTYDGNPDGYSALLLTLPAVAGLTGATLRIPNSFMIAVCGGRNVKFMTTLLLILPAVGAGVALRNPDTPFYVLIILAALSGIGGGAFASSMSNISFFFPKRMQGLALGLNAGLGNAGVSVMQFLIPWVITLGLFGGLGGDPQKLIEDDQPTELWIQNAALIWVPIMAFLSVLAFLFMNNLPQHKIGSTVTAVGNFLWLTFLGFVAGGIGVVLLVIDWGRIPELFKIFITLGVTVTAAMVFLRWLTVRDTQSKLQSQFAIFRNKHNWIMTWLYTMTFGSFIGYANAFPMLLDVVFGQVAVSADGTPLTEPVVNVNGPTTAYFIWIGAAVGALIRPVGGWLSDKFGGARVTQWDTWIMVAATVLAGFFVAQARVSPHPETYFAPFLITFIVLFATTGIGNGSTFRMIPIIFSKEQAGPVLGWTSAIAAYGAYLIPKIIGTQIEAGTPENALYAFAAYYASCLALNWWYYARANAEIKC